MRSYNNKGNNGLYFFRIIFAFVLICVSIITIYIVVGKVGNLKIAEGITIKGEDVKFFIKQDEMENDMFFVSDEKGLRCKKPDGSFARDEWIEKNGELFYFDTSSYGKDGDYRLEGQVYTLESGKLKKIVKDKSYATNQNKDYFSSVESTTFVAYLEKTANEDNYYAIRYMKYGDNEDDYLGTENDKQYASPYMIKANENMIYYLALGDRTSYAGRLYRMHPNGTLREVVGTSVQGYIVLSSDIVYYYDGARVIKAKSWKEEEVKVLEVLDDPFSMQNGMLATDSNVISDFIKSLPLPVPLSNDEMTEAVKEDETTKEKETENEETLETTKEKETTKQNTYTNNDNIKKEDAIVAEPLEQKGDVSIDKNDKKARADYVEDLPIPIENVKKANTPPAKGDVSFSTNTPGR